MQRRRLANTDIEVSVLGLGTVKFGRNQAVKYPHAFQLPSDTEIQQLLMIAQEAGINLLDTAPAYGESEARLGKLLAKRSDWVISTKVGEYFIDGRSYFDFSQASIVRSIEQSLYHLRTDYLDIVLVHSNGEDKKIIKDDNVFLTLETLKQQGKILAYGMSTKTIAGGKLTLDVADVAMVTYRPDYVAEQSVLDYAQQKQKNIIIKKALASGHLQQINHPNPIAHSLQFCLAHPTVCSVIIGTTNAKHLQENIRCIS